ncbi:AEC family transporter [candidate division KSB1 bacterium]|nr:AEC family transporter [candidate division KSB1 bacterium]
MSMLIHAINIVAPVFIIVFIGYGLRKRGMIDEAFTRVSSKVVFSVAMPMLVFVKIANMPIHQLINWRQIGFACCAILVAFLVCWVVAYWISKNGRDRGAFIQGAFRSNFAILGFALLSNAFGIEVLGKAAIVLSFIMILYNVLSVIALAVPQKKERQISARQMLIELITNPLVLAAVIAVPISLFNIRLPVIVNQSAEQLAALTLPLALIGIGGSLSFSGLKKDLQLSLVAASLKIVLIPLIVTICAVRLGFRGEDLGVLFFLFASPTAIASYIMADAMGSNSRLAGHIILITTLSSIVTISIGIIWLKSLGLM